MLTEQKAGICQECTSHVRALSRSHARVQADASPFPSHADTLVPVKTRLCHRRLGFWGFCCFLFYPTRSRACVRVLMKQPVLLNRSGCFTSRNLQICGFLSLVSTFSRRRPRWSRR